MTRKEQYDDFRELKFPGFPENDKFAHWVENFIEVDTYYAGCIDSALHTPKPFRKIEKTHFIETTTQFNKLLPKSKKDQELYKTYKKYLVKLEAFIDGINQEQ